MICAGDEKMNELKPETKVVLFFAEKRYAFPVKLICVWGSNGLVHRKHYIFNKV